jgi:translation initiation factor 2 alpha subunit (eIF-2alpha)
MFHYNEKIPKKGTVVVAEMIPEPDNEHCIYVTLPEYKNYRAIIYKAELPKRIKIQKKIITDMKRAGVIVCTVSNSPKFLSVKSSSREVISQEAISQEVISQEVISQEVISQKVISQEVISQEVISQEAISQEVISQEAISQEAISQKVISQEAISQEAISQEVISQGTISPETKSLGSVPANHDNGLDPGLIELSIKGVAEKHHANILARNKNIKKFLKIIRFVSQAFDLNYNQLVANFHNTIIKPIIEIDEMTGVDDYNDIYCDHLRNHDKLLQLMGIPVPGISGAQDSGTRAPDYDLVHRTLNNMIKKTNASASLEFDLAVWKTADDQDAIYLLREIFDQLQNDCKDIDLRYVGAPKYQINIQDIEFSKIDELYQRIKNMLISMLKNKNVTGYDLKFDPSKKTVKHGEISISFPFKIMINL